MLFSYTYLIVCCVGGQDYESFEEVLDSITLTFNRIQQTVKETAETNINCANVFIFADEILEGDETFQLRISEDEEDLVLSIRTSRWWSY